jgi:hypothetical protein
MCSGSDGYESLDRRVQPPDMQENDAQMTIQHGESSDQADRAGLPIPQVPKI